MKTIMTVVLFISALFMTAQNVQTIQGIVTDQSTGAPLAGVRVSSPSDKSVLTNTDGKYSIKAKASEVLSFRLIGYETHEIRVDKDTVVNIGLYPTSHQLEEITVVDYVSRKKETLTGSTAIISKSDTKDAPSANFTDLLQGRASGLNLQANNSSQGMRGEILFRGISKPQNTESYKGFVENKFVSPLKEALSTFAADVDVASYNNIKRFIASGKLPSVDAVRVEEMINYFDYQLEGPKGNHPVAIHTELSISPWNSGHQLLRISLKAKDIPKEKLAASNFVFLIDISGSMSEENKLPLVKSSLKLLVDQLRITDRVAIVTYAGNAKVALESISGDKKMKIKEVIDGLQAGGSTAGGDGLRMAYQMAKQHFIASGNNRIVMTTDGDFNVGASSDEDMEKLIVRERESGVNISVLGYGMGNYKDSKLELLANKGRGNYAYINNITEARKAMVTEFGATMHTVAKDVKIQVEFNPKYVQYYRLVGYENRLMEAEDFNNDAKVGGDMGVGHTVTAIYDIVPVGVKSSFVGSVDPLKYQKNENKIAQNNSTDLATVKFRYKDPNSDRSKLQEHIVSASQISSMSQDFQFATAVAELGMLLRQSEYRQEASFDKLIQRAKASKGIDSEGYRTEFIRMAEDAQALMKSNSLTIK